MTRWARRQITARVQRSYAKLALDPDSGAAFVRFVAWLLVAVLAGADLDEDY